MALGDTRTTPPRPEFHEIYPQYLSTQYLVVWGSKKQRGIVEISQKEELSLIKTK